MESFFRALIFLILFEQPYNFSAVSFAEVSYATCFLFSLIFAKTFLKCENRKRWLILPVENTQKAISFDCSSILASQ